MLVNLSEYIYISNVSCISAYLALLKKNFFKKSGLEGVYFFFIIMQTKFSINLGHRNIIDQHYYIYLINLFHMLIQETWHSKTFSVFFLTIEFKFAIVSTVSSFYSQISSLLHYCFQWSYTSLLLWTTRLSLE